LAPETVGEMSKETQNQMRMPGFADEQAEEFQRLKDAIGGRHNGGKKVLRARPVKAEVDHEALTPNWLPREAAIEINRAAAWFLGTACS
jgi:hypothetical protein